MSKKMSSKHWLSFIETLIILGFTILPTLIGLILMSLNDEVQTFERFYNSGEFLLYSVSLLGSSFIVYNKFKIQTIDWKSTMTAFITFSLIIIAVFYAGIISTTSPNIFIIKWASLISFPISLVIFYRSQVLSNTKPPDIGDERRNEQESIMNSIN